MAAKQTLLCLTRSAKKHNITSKQPTNGAKNARNFRFVQQ